MGLITFEESEVDEIEGIGEEDANKVRSLKHTLIQVFLELMLGRLDARCGYANVNGGDRVHMNGVSIHENG
jgi:hypothetical protein